MPGVPSLAFHRTRLHVCLGLAAVLVLVTTACGDDPPKAPAPSTPAPTATPAVARPPEVTATPTPTAVRTAAPTVAAALKPAAPTAGRWIDVDVTRFTVKLMDGKQVVREIGPVGVGAQIDTGAYESTQTGLFRVYNKTAGLTFDAPYNTYIDWWVGFDVDKANGFHSFLLDAKGTVVDASTGRISNGCIRTPDPKAVFEFAEVGMPVFVHA
ncbi:MAG: hypothetical protein EPO65_03300 [Dehalococcoidia bacterium]|nr:MAG: hypothetical protein EPO65_03300 [Dehalococcoidia bacterium]